MGQGFVQTCPEPKLGKLTNSSNKWNVPAAQEGVWRFLAPAGGGRRTTVSGPHSLAHPSPDREGAAVQAPGRGLTAPRLGRVNPARRDPHHPCQRLLLFQPPGLALEVSQGSI